MGAPPTAGRWLRDGNVMSGVLERIGSGRCTSSNTSGAAPPGRATGDAITSERSLDASVLFTIGGRSVKSTLGAPLSALPQPGQNRAASVFDKPHRGHSMVARG